MTQTLQKKMRTLSALCLLASLGAPVCVLGAAPVELTIGQDAPDFTLPDAISGKAQTLAKQKGKWVVLEWTNHGCPYVQAQYDSGNMQKVQAAAKDKGAIWWSINSSAPGLEGNVDATQAKAEVKQFGSKANAVLLDPAGDVGHKYGAKTTPHLFIIDPKGKLVYQGAMDPNETTEKGDVKFEGNYVLAALNSASAGQPVKDASTKPYGCNVKYKKK